MAVTAHTSPLPESLSSGLHEPVVDHSVKGEVGHHSTEPLIVNGIPHILIASPSLQIDEVGHPVTGEAHVGKSETLGTSGTVKASPKAPAVVISGVVPANQAGVDGKLSATPRDLDGANTFLYGSFGLGLPLFLPPPIYGGFGPGIGGYGGYPY